MVGTMTQGPQRELQKIHADTDEKIIHYVNELKEHGFEIIEFPPIEKFRNYFICNILCEPPRASE